MRLKEQGRGCTRRWRWESLEVPEVPEIQFMSVHTRSDESGNSHKVSKVPDVNELSVTDLTLTLDFETELNENITLCCC